MTTVFGRRYNREFQQHIMDTILSFHDTPTQHRLCGWVGELRLRITVRKNMYLGTVWLEYHHPHGVIRKKYNHHNHWTRSVTPAFRQLLFAFSFASPDERVVFRKAMEDLAPPLMLDW